MEAASHAAIMDAVYELLQETSARELTMEAVAKRAGVGKPTLYKWWPTKVALIMAMFGERLGDSLELPNAGSVEAGLRARMKSIVGKFNGPMGKVMANLVAEGQSDPSVLTELFEEHIRPRRDAAIEAIKRAVTSGEFSKSVEPEVLIDALYGPLYQRLLLKHAPLNEAFAEALLAQVMRGARG
jgi:AcrR family transcriptional regulator